MPKRKNKNRWGGHQIGDVGAMQKLSKPQSEPYATVYGIRGHIEYRWDMYARKYAYVMPAAGTAIALHPMQGRPTVTRVLLTINELKVAMRRGLTSYGVLDYKN